MSPVLSPHVNTVHRIISKLPYEPPTAIPAVDKVYTERLVASFAAAEVPVDGGEWCEVCELTPDLTRVKNITRLTVAEEER